MKNYYDILEVSRKASKDTINKVFKMHMKANHPDLFQDEEKQKAEEKSKELTEAYNILSDDAARAKYDSELEAEESTNQFSDVQTILEENEYLKQVIAKKDEYINMLTGNAQGYSDPYANTQYNQYSGYNQGYANQGYSNPGYNQGYANQGYQNTGYGFNGFTPPPQADPYANMTVEDLKRLKRQQQIEYYKSSAKELGAKALVLVIVILILLISMWSSLKDLAKLFVQ